MFVARVFFMRQIFFIISIHCLQIMGFIPELDQLLYSTLSNAKSVLRGLQLSYSSIVDSYRKDFSREIAAEVVDGVIVKGLDVLEQLHHSREEKDLRKVIAAVLPEENQLVVAEQVESILVKNISRKLQTIQYEVYRSEKKRIQSIVEKKPEVFNLTSVEVADDLKLVAEQGLKFVGQKVEARDALIQRIETGVKNGIVAILKKREGFKIILNSEENIEMLVKRAKLLSPRNSTLLDSILLRFKKERARARDFGFENSSTEGAKIRKICLKERENIYAEVSDKNIGITQYDLGWSQQQYKDQTSKGAYTEVNKDEVAVLAELIAGLEKMDSEMSREEEDLFKRYDDYKQTDEAKELGQVTSVSFFTHTIILILS